MIVIKWHQTMTWHAGYFSSLMSCTRHFRSIWSSFKEISGNKVPILFKDTRLAQFFMTSDFLKRVSVSHWHGYKFMMFEIFEIQPCDCKGNQASWSAGHLEGSMNVNLTCKISKKFHIPKQTPSTGGSSRQSHSRCSVHIYIYILSSSLQSSLSKLFVAGSDLALRKWYAFFGFLVAFATRTMISGVQYSRWWSKLHYTT